MEWSWMEEESGQTSPLQKDLTHLPLESTWEDQLMAALDDEITMTEDMIEDMMIVTITADHIEEVAVAEEEDGELFKTGISFTGGDHHPHITVEGATDLDPDLDPIHLVAIKA